MEKKENEKTMIRVLLIDDHPIVRSGIKSELEKSENILFVGEASGGKEGVELAGKILFDVLLIDISMPGMNGIEAAELILKKNPSAKIIVLTMHDDENYVHEFIKLGAKGYILKDSNPEELIKAIESANNNIPYYSPQVSGAILSQNANRGLKKPVENEILSPREKEVLLLLVNDKKNKEIALKLNLSVRTVETHREHIMQKLNIRSISGLTKYALSKKLTKLDQ